MGDVAIRVENLGKRYKIGERVRPKTFGEMLAGVIYTPFKEPACGCRRPKRLSVDVRVWFGH